MKYSYYIVFLPSKALRMLNGPGAELSDELSRIVLWRHQRGHSKAPPHLYEESVKELFLSFLEASCLHGRPLEEVLGEAVTDRQVLFDRFWTAHHFNDIDLDVEDAVSIVQNAGRSVPRYFAYLAENSDREESD